MARRDDRKRLGKKHRQASTRPKQGRAPRTVPTTGAVGPRKRKVLATKRAALAKKKRAPTRSPENESRKIISRKPHASRKAATPKTSSSPGSIASKPASKEPSAARPTGHIVGRQMPHSANGRSQTGSVSEVEAWGEAELLAAQLDASDLEPRTANLPLIAICGRPNVGKSTLFNRLTGSRRSIVGDEPGITRDRIYGLIEWQSAGARLVDTGGVVPDDPELIPAEIFRQAQTALDQAQAIILVVDGRTELASPDIALARLLLRGGKPVFLAVNKIDTAALAPAAENFRRLGFRNLIVISAEHGSGIGDLLDAVFAALPAPAAETLSSRSSPSPSSRGEAEGPASVSSPLTTQNSRVITEPPRRLRSHGAFVERETRIAIIGRPNVGKSTLLNTLTGSDRAIVSPIAGTTRDAVDEIVTRGAHDFHFVDTAGIRRKGKTKLMAEKLSVVMARKHLEAADLSLLVLDASEGVAALDANIGGYAHQSGRSVIIVVNKWDLAAHPQKRGPRSSQHLAKSGSEPDSPPPPRGDQKLYEQQVRDKLKYLDYAPLLFISASTGAGIEALFKKIELVARERRKRITTGQMNRFLATIDFQRASVPMDRRVRIYYMTQAAVAPPTFILFTDRAVKLHFAFERFLANQIRAAFGFIGAPIWFKTRPRNKKSPEE